MFFRIHCHQLGGFCVEALQFGVGFGCIFVGGLQCEGFVVPLFGFVFLIQLPVGHGDEQPVVRHVGTEFDGLLQCVDRFLPLLSSIKSDAQRVQQSAVIGSQFVGSASPLDGLRGMRIQAVLVGVCCQFPRCVVVGAGIIRTQRKQPRSQRKWVVLTFNRIEES